MSLIKRYKVAAVSCSYNGYCTGGVDRCIFVTGKPRSAWVVVHGQVHGAGWVGGGVVYLLEPATSLLSYSCT